MGIESALAAIGTWLGASGTAATAVGGMAVASAATTAMSAAAALKKPKMPGIPGLTEQDRPPQATRTPDRTPMAAGNLAAGRMGNAGTFLTGAGGIDSAMLNLGRNTLLGQ